ncbi:MAG: hypothetical protein MK008_13400 [Bdellovibrionales bacterium]|nr:hypothetical protein [Bdellovibrionales bacterium]
MSNNKLVWSDTDGDLRKKSKKSSNGSSPVDENSLTLKLRRLTAGKGRTVIEISDLPNNKKWCQSLAKDIKKALGVGGTYKNDFIEIHGEKIDKITDVLDSKSIKWKKTGG